MKFSENENIDTIIAVGGGKVIDSGKAVANILEAPIVTIPTIPSTCAPVTPLSVIYNDNGVYREYYFLKSKPTATLVDLGLLLRSPKVSFKAGLADALVKYFEGRARFEKDPLQENISYGYFVSKRIRKEVMTIRHLKGNILEDVVDINILFAGLAGENVGEALAHTLYNSLTLVKRKSSRYLLHGEIIAFTTLIQLIVEKRSEHEILEYVKWAKTLGLPLSFKDLGLKISEEDLEHIIKFVLKLEGTFNEPVPINEEVLFSAFSKYAEYVNRLF